MVGNVSSFIPDVVKARLAASLLFYLIEHPTEIDSLSEDGIKKVSTLIFNATSKHYYHIPFIILSYLFLLLIMVLETRRT
uniref:Uncharacterized protein n=1 Tax=Heterorhabditis bacteriophora TaxID=37862 RepID=A0A1I7WYK4_HETBA